MRESEGERGPSRLHQTGRGRSLLAPLDATAVSEEVEPGSPGGWFLTSTLTTSERNFGLDKDLTEPIRNDPEPSRTKEDPAELKRTSCDPAKPSRTK